MILDTTSKTVEIVLGTAITTNQLEVTADWVDINASGLFAPGGTSLLTNGTTAVTAVGSPAANVQRQVKSLVIFNADTANATVTVRLFDGTNRRRYIVTTLAAGQSLVFTPEGGWSVPAGPVQTSGLWTPIDVSADALTFAAPTGGYWVRTGNLVYISFEIIWPTNSGTHGNGIGGLPFTINPNAVYGRPTGAILSQTALANGPLVALANNNTTTLSLFYSNSSFGIPTNANLSGAAVFGSVTYSV